MLLIAAALGEELNTALRLFPAASKSRAGGIPFWTAGPADGTILLVKTGMGPRKSAQRIAKILQEVRPSRILIAGYAGALDARLKVGDLFVARRAIPFWRREVASTPSGDREPEGGVELGLWPELYAAASAAGPTVHVGDLLTSGHVVGDPKRKARLWHHFGTGAVDMETAAISAVAAEQGIAAGCVRAISDTARDDFLLPFSGDPSVGFLARTSKIGWPGDWAGSCRQWREQTAAARESLRLFLSAYLRIV